MRGCMQTLFVSGASSGIGREIAVELSNQYNLVLCSRNVDKLKETACLCNKQSEVRLFPYDLTKVDNLSSDLGNYLAKENITVQKFVHCAGTARMKHLHMITSEDFISMYNVYTVSAAMIIKALAGRANKRELNSVVFISSHNSARAVKGMSYNHAAKAGLEELGRCLTIELAPKVRINAVKVGLTKTTWTEEIYENDSLLQAYDKNYPFGSLTPKDIVGAVDFLLSEKASKVIGESLIIDGGFSIDGSVKIDM